MLPMPCTQEIPADSCDAKKATEYNVDICLQPNGRSEAPDPDAFDLEEELNQCLGFGTLWSSSWPMISREMFIPF